MCLFFMFFMLFLFLFLFHVFITQTILTVSSVVSQFSHMIRSIPFFANVQKLALLADLFSFREYAKDDILFWQGDEADAFYILIRGECAVYGK